ncbi:alkaline phosphatase family protein [Parvularcula bermudensis HTCC2503]|uniref:Alkaline phosphatase family protein n=1 Tax=Parvularcula bermudensis (strain ATCC BAA-594 / HTCC2503 / KCTC 12087) TaxID=314260 RepID=E0TDX9_PARBH|nr:alkaline phosphatase [Parvularcula bermudensis]ADM10428.1 alkaline phosphatase family protein [Parvularcula bermudensis HTCC2503]
MVLAVIAASALAMQSASVSPAGPTDWVAQGEAALEAAKAVTPRVGRAKNAILFIADGMDVTTITAGRILAGQQQGKLGEDHVLAFETLPFTALSKTYTTNMQTADSAGTATAMLSGHKTKSGVINVDQTVPRGDCAAAEGKALTSLMHVAAATDRQVGVVSTARLTHATPATVYASSADRNWEADRDLPEEADGCTDIATQLITAAQSFPIRVALGGGRRNFLPQSSVDPEYDDKTGAREDGRNLTAEWTAIAPGYLYVWNAEQFGALSPTEEGAVLGLFEPSHMNYAVDRQDDAAGEPSLSEMTSFAIDKLSQHEEGYFLLVEGGRIDHAHHAGNAARALNDLIAFDAAIETALQKVDLDETLIIVTADHGHTLVLQGYPHRGNPILGLVRSVNGAGAPIDTPFPGGDGKPYTTLVYGNGPGSPFARPSSDQAIERQFVTDDEAQAIDYRQQSIVPGGSETHGGQDVTIHAVGPQAHLIRGTVEQNYIYYVIRDALTYQAE